MAARAQWSRYAGRAAAAVALMALLAAGITIAAQRRSVLQPSTAQVSLVMWRTVLAVEPEEHFYPAGQQAITSDGSGGNLTAEVGAVMPTTDGDGQLVFFWHDNHFVGWDSMVDSMDVLQMQPLGPKQFQVTYANYAPDDPACCPSLIPVSVVYRWSGHRFVANGPLPLYAPIPDVVHLIR